MGDSIKQYMQRPKRYANIDGTVEMGVGVCLLGLALMGYAEAALPPKDSIWQHGFPGRLFLAFIVITFCCLGYFGPKAIKKYITYPRTGYVVLRGPKGFSWTSIASCPRRWRGNRRWDRIGGAAHCDRSSPAGDFGYERPRVVPDGSFLRAN